MTKFPGVFDSIKNYIWKFEFNFKFIDPLSELLKQFHCSHCSQAPSLTTYLKYLIPMSAVTSYLLNPMEDFKPCLTFIYLHYSVLLTNPWSLNFSLFSPGTLFYCRFCLFLKYYFSRHVSDSFSGNSFSMQVLGVSVLRCASLYFFLFSSFILLLI